MRCRFLSLVLVLPALAGAAPDTATATGPGGAPAQAKPEAKSGQWQLSVGAAAADGTRSIAATLRSDAPIAGAFGEVTPRLVLRYRAGQPAAYVVFETYLGEGELDAEVAFGDQPAERQKWTIAADGQTAFVAGEAFEFIQRLKTVPKLSVRVTPPKKAPVAVTFTLRETEAVLKALISAGVKYGG